MEGWIKLHRKLLDWEWYQDNNVKIVFLHCLLRANIIDVNWKGILIKRGQFFTSTKHLSTELKLTEKQIRLCLKKLSAELLIKGASNGTMITICKYDDYQYFEKQKGKQRASKGQTKGKQRATNREEEEEIEEKEIIVDSYFSDTELNNLFIDHLEIRKKLKAVNTDLAISKLISKLRELTNNNKDTAIKILENSITNSWKSYFPLK